MNRNDGRRDDELRTVSFEVDFTENPLASVLCSMGRTRVLCTICEEDSVPRFLLGSGRGWVTADIPCSPAPRTAAATGRFRAVVPSGRSQEIQRLIGRSLRAIVDLASLGERTLWADCDVLQADGGTRTASITGAYTALAIAVERLRARGSLARVAAARFGRRGVRGARRRPGGAGSSLRGGFACRSRHEHRGDGSGRFVEVQGTAEQGTFSPEQLGRLTALAQSGIAELGTHQSDAIARARRDS